MVLGYSVNGDSKVKKFLCDFLGGELAPLRGASGRCAARSAASGKRKRPPAQRKIFGFHNPHYRFPDTELSGIRARTLFTLVGLRVRKKTAAAAAAAAARALAWPVPPGALRARHARRARFVVFHR